MLYYLLSENYKYIDVDHLYCRGNSYINLPETFIPNETTRIVGSYKSELDAFSFVFGSRESANERTFGLGVRVTSDTTTRLSTGVGTGNWVTRDITLKSTDWVSYDIDINGSAFRDSLGTDLYYPNANQDAFIGKAPMSIGRLEGNWVTYTGFLRSQTIYHNGALAFDLVIKKRIRDGVVGFYDTLTDTFYPSIGAPFLQSKADSAYPTFEVVNGSLIQGSTNETEYTNFSIENKELVVEYTDTQSEPQLIIEDGELFEIIP